MAGSRHTFSALRILRRHLKEPAPASRSATRENLDSSQAAGQTRRRPPVPLPVRFDTIMPKTLATAAVDRLLHHAHVTVTEGTSLRLTEATAGKGVVPLT